MGSANSNSHDFNSFFSNFNAPKLILIKLLFRYEIHKKTLNVKFIYKIKLCVNWRYKEKNLSPPPKKNKELQLRITQNSHWTKNNLWETNNQINILLTLIN